MSAVCAYFYPQDIEGFDQEFSIEGINIPTEEYLDVTNKIKRDYLAFCNVVIYDTLRNIREVPVCNQHNLPVSVQTRAVWTRKRAKIQPYFYCPHCFDAVYGKIPFSIYGKIPF